MVSISADKRQLKAEAFRSDPRVVEARRLIGEAVADHSKMLTGVCAPDPDFVAEYESLLERLGEARGGNPVWPYLASGLGNGPFVELADGSVKLDFISGIGVHGCGHSDPAMVQAALAGALEDTVMQGNLQQHRPTLEMCERLVQLASESGARMDHCLLTTSGAMANDNALKIAFHNKSPADRVIAFRRVFAGRSIAMASVTDKPSYRQGIPLALTVDYLPFLDPDDAAGSTAEAVDELHRLLQRHPGRYAAFWAELITGEGGYYPGSHEFFRALCEPMRNEGVAIIFDEVQSFSRTSRAFAFQHFGLDEFADIVTVGKITQVCATLYGKDLRPTSPILSQTFTGASSSIATGIAMLEQLESSGCFGAEGRNIQRHEYFVSGLKRLHDAYPKLINGPYGEGMMIGFTPGDGTADQAKKLMMLMFDHGLLGFVCGSDPVRIRFLPPPVTTTNAHIDLAIKLLGDSLSQFTVDS